MKILIVEDNENSRVLLESAFEVNGYEVASAENGKIALESVLRDPPDLIISDILMPEMDGFALCRALKAKDRFRDIPIVFYTATYTDPGDEKLAMDLGAARFFVKPMEIDHLLAEIKALLVSAEEKVFPPAPQKDEKQLEKEYSLILTKKLDKKVRELEEEKRRLAEKEKTLQESLQKFYSIVENIGIGVVLISPNMEILEFNRQMRQWFPDIDAAIHPTCYRALYDPPRESCCDSCPAVMTFQDKKVHEITKIMHQSGKARNYRIVSSPITNEKGDVTAVVEMVEDITDRLEFEKRQRQSQKLESIGNLAGGIAHDFNNLLTSILGFAELALEEVKKGSMIEDYLQEVYSAGKRAKDLVGQILVFARQSEENVKPIQVGKIVIEVLKFIRSSIPTTIEINQHIKSDSLILADTTQVHQIVMNLCTNAAQAMEDEGGVLTVSVRDVHMDKGSESFDESMEPGGYVELRVSDTGTGIDPDIIDRIFEPYFTTKGSGEGTGMGLALVHGIVESYAGKINVLSEKGKGTSFIIYLPISKNSRADWSYKSEEIPMGKERILFVDDDEAVVKIGTQVLKRLGYSVTTQSNSVDALALFRSVPNDFDLVITDMTMPVMTGDALAVELMKIRSDIPVILCTGYSKKISHDSAIKLGIKAFAYKPIVMADLAKTIRSVLDESKSST